MRTEILNYIKAKDGYVSGEEMAHKFRLSRQALWKHIQEMRSLGYDIVAVPHLGYKLLKVPDKVYSWEITSGLTTGYIGKQVMYFEKTSSTMDSASQLGKENAREGAVVCAEYQSHGRGRLGRTWVSTKGKGLSFSILLRPNVLISQVPCITLLAAIAVVQGIKRTVSLPLTIKWPNDILIKDRKLAGILTELAAEQDRINFVVVGIGVNVNNAPGQMVDGATSLYAQCHRKYDRAALMRDILEEFEEIYTKFKRNGPEVIINTWRRLSYIWGSKVKVSLTQGVIEGEAIDLDNDGALLVRTDSGVIEKVVAGDVVKKM